MSRQRARQAAGWFASGRAVLGAGMFISPGLASAVWIGRRPRDPALELFVRGLAARDVALGIGALRALREDQGPGRWIAMSALADAGDGVATLMARPYVGGRPRLVWSGLAIASAATGAWLSRLVDR